MVGRLQRIAAAEAEAAAAESDAAEAAPEFAPGRSSFLVSFLVGLWSWGLMGPQTIQNIADRAPQDLEAALADSGRAAVIKADLTKLAKIGNRGAYLGNMHRDLMNSLEKTKVVLWYCMMPVRRLGVPSGTLAYLIKQSMLLPHVLFSTMGNSYPAAFAKLMCPSPQRLQQFWTAMTGSPQLHGDMSQHTMHNCCSELP